MNLTAIFPPDVKPVNIGVYRTADTEEKLRVIGDVPFLYRYWNGMDFGPAAFEPQLAADLHESLPNIRTPAGTCYWQGVDRNV